MELARVVRRLGRLAPPPRLGRRIAQRAHDLACQRERVVVVGGHVVDDAASARVHLCPAELLRGHVLAGRGLHERRAAEEDRAGAAHDHRLVAHGRHVGAARGARSHHHRDLGDARGRHARLVVEDAAEVVAVGEHLGLERQVGAAGVGQVDAGEVVLRRHLLRAQVLLDREREVASALDRGVVCDDHARAAGDRADAGDDARRRRLAVVEAVSRERRELQERRARVDQALDPLAGEQLAAGVVALDGSHAAACADALKVAVQLRHQPVHALAIALVGLRAGVEMAGDTRHRRRLPVRPERQADI